MASQDIIRIESPPIIAHFQNHAGAGAADGDIDGGTPGMLDGVLYRFCGDLIKSAGEDRFDCLLGVLCVINVLAGHRPDSTPDDPWLTTWEGWVLGQTALPVDPR